MKLASDQIINIVLVIIHIAIVINSHQVISNKIHRTSCRSEATFKANATNFVVKEGSLKLNATINAPSLSHCAKSCIRTSVCKSANFKKKTSARTEKNCQLLTVEKAGLAHNDISISTGWIYYEPLLQVFTCSFMASLYRHSMLVTMRHLSKS